MRRTLTEFLSKELLFEHLRTVYRHYLETGGYERGEMVERLSEFLESDDGTERLAEGLGEEEIECLYLLRQIGGIAPRRWLFRELVNRGVCPDAEWSRVFRRLRSRHLVFLIGSDVAYLPDGMSDAIGDLITGMPERVKSDVIPGPSSIRQSVHGLVVALLAFVHQGPPRVMAEEERIWKRDLVGMGDFFHSYLFEAEAGGGSIKQVRGRIGRLVELLRKMGFLEKRGKRLYVDPESWSDWARRVEVDRQSFLLSFLKDHYENLTTALEVLVEWQKAGWIPLDRLTEAVHYRTLRSNFHILRIRPQAEVTAKGPGRRWVAACVHLLADLGLVYTGSDSRGEPVARATDGALLAWRLMHDPKARRRRKEIEGPRAYAQPNFELLVPEESRPDLHRDIGAIAELRSLDRFWTYVLTPESVARGVEEGLTVDDVLAILDRRVEGNVPPNVRDAAQGWARTAWWITPDGDNFLLKAESDLFENIRSLDGVPERFELVDHSLRPIVPMEDASRWLEERGIRVASEDRDSYGELDAAKRRRYARALEAWKRRLSGSDGASARSFWDDAIPVEPLPEQGAAR